MSLVASREGCPVLSATVLDDANNARQITEMITLITGVLVSLLGAWRQLRSRREDDAALIQIGGQTAVDHAKAVSDIIGLDPTYLEQIERNFALLDSKLKVAESLLRQHGIRF